MIWQRGINEALRPLSLTQPQFALLATIGWLTRDGAAVSQQELADFLGLERMHVSQIAARLDTEGLVVRIRPSIDRRCKSLGLTETGVQRMQAALPVVEDFDRVFFARRAAGPGSAATGMESSQNTPHHS